MICITILIVHREGNGPFVASWLRNTSMRKKRNIRDKIRTRTKKHRRTRKNTYEEKDVRQKKRRTESKTYEHLYSNQWDQSFNGHKMENIPLVRDNFHTIVTPLNHPLPSRKVKRLWHGHAGTPRLIWSPFLAQEEDILSNVLQGTQINSMRKTPQRN